MKNLQEIKYRGGFLSSFVIFVGGDARWKGKHCHITLLCEITCDNRISKHFLIETGKIIYTISST